MEMETDVGLVDRVRRIISGTNPTGEAPEPEPEVAVDKVDGRTKEFKQTVQRIGDGQKRKNGEGLDGRTKTYKDTLKRIQANREKLKDK